MIVYPCAQRTMSDITARVLVINILFCYGIRTNDSLKLHPSYLAIDSHVPLNHLYILFFLNINNNQLIYPRNFYTQA